jgi:hypothetical protein
MLYDESGSGYDSRIEISQYVSFLGANFGIPEQQDCLKKTCRKEARLR